MDWSNCGEYLAVAGFIRLPNLQCRNELHFYSKDGKLRHWVIIPSQVSTNWSTAPSPIPPASEHSSNLALCIQPNLVCHKVGGRKGGKSRVGSSRVASEPNQEGLVVWLFVKKKLLLLFFLGFFLWSKM